MKIDPKACEWYGLKIDTLPPVAVTAWEASIDGGTTYVAAESVELPVDGVDVAHSAWLVAGPDYAGPSTPAFVTAGKYTHVKVRLIDNPETVIRASPTRITTELA